MVVYVSMRLLTTFVRTYPRRSAVAFAALLVGALAEGVGLTALLPLLALAVGDGAAAGIQGGPGGAVMRVLARLGVEGRPWALLLLIVAAIAIRSGFLLLANRQVGYTVARVATDLRLSIIRALLAARWEYYAGQPVGAAANTIATEATRASAAYLHGMSAIALLVQSLIYVTVAVLVSWQVALVALATGLAFFSVMGRLVRASRRAGARQTTLLRSLLARLADLLQAVKPLKAMAREETGGRLLEEETVRLDRALRREVFNKEALRALQDSAFMLLTVTGLYVALTWWRLPLPTMMVLGIVLARILTQLGKVQREYQVMATSESAYWALQKTLEEAEGAREVPLGHATPRLARAIRFEDVGFGYATGWVLRDARVEIPAGGWTTIVGPSGAGKTTLVDLVTALLRPQTGEIWIDDIPLADVDRRAWRRMIGYVPQETLLLSDSVLVNVTLGDPDVSAADAEAALRAAGAWEFVAALPQRMDAAIGERGARLSGGQRQRLAIARALVHRPVLLILDEATSALDADSEAGICATLQALRGTLTILAVSHRPALVEAADRVYRVDEGRVTPAERLSGAARR
jgi:ATP-binding cassette, subfamily C, bacterial